MSTSLDVSIMGREFRVACPAGEERALHDAVDYLDKKMNEIRESGKVVGTERIAVMVALNIAHELISARPSADFDVDALKHRMNLMRNNIDNILSEQEKSV